MRYPISEKCLRNSTPPCVEKCPYHLNVRQFMERISDGRFDFAYHNALVSSVVFPEIATSICGQTCLQVCPRRVSVNAIEKACIAFTRKKEPHRFRLQARGKSVAVVGGGISGLACGIKLASKKYDVTVFESGDRLGGSILQLLPEELVRSEIDRHLGQENLKILLNSPAASLELIRQFDAVYIATGADGPDLGLLPGWNSDTLETNEPGVFLGGRLGGADHAQALAQGIKASYAIEYYTKVGLAQPQERADAKPCGPLNSGVADGGGTDRAADAEFKSKEEAVAAAQKCDLCLCTSCMDNCVFMQKRGLTPQVIERDGMMAEVPPVGFEDRVGNRMILSCAQCGVCRSVCPQQIDLGEFLLDKRTKLWAQGLISPALHDYFIREMQECSEDLFFTDKPGNKLHYLFFPGCQSISSDPEQVLAAYAWLQQGDADTGILLSCCGVSAEWEGDAEGLQRNLDRIRRVWDETGRPALVTNCPNCMRVFRKYAQDIPVTSIYELLVERGLPAEAEVLPDPHFLFHPCAGQDDPALRRAALQVAAACSKAPVETADTPTCCGLGGHIYPAAPEIASAMLEEARSRSPLPYLAYCANCRNLFLHTGKDCRHLLDVVFHIAPAQRPPHIHELQYNRRRLFARLKGLPEQTPPDLRTHFSQELLAKMDRDLLSAGDASRIIEKARFTGDFICCTTDGSFFANGRCGALTLWAEWQEEETGYRVRSVYAHRMELDETLNLPAAGSEGAGAGKSKRTDAEAYACHNCRTRLALLPVVFRYLGHEFRQEMPRCPNCGKVMIPESFVRTRMHDVEIMVEDK